MSACLPPNFAWPQTSQQFGGLSVFVPQPSPSQMLQLVEHLHSSASTLQQIPIATIVAAIDRAAQQWLVPDYPPRLQLLDQLPQINGYSPAMLNEVLDRMLADWRAPQLWQRLNEQFGDPLLLDGWRPSVVGESRLFGPHLTWHICAGNVPGVAIQSLIDGLLVKSPSLVKVARGEPLWAAAFATSLIEQLPALAESLAVLWWSGGDHALEAPILAKTEAIIANASDAAIAAVRQRSPAHIRWLDYGSRYSLAYISQSRLSAPDLAEIASKLAYDSVMLEQQGCVSPQAIMLEAPTAAQLSQFGLALNQALDDLSQRYPASSSILAATRRSADDYEWQALSGQPIQLLSQPEQPWLVVVDQREALPSAAGRLIKIVPVADLAELATRLKPLHQHLQSVTLVCSAAQRHELAEALAAIGVLRICQAGQQAFPQAAWHHDGRDPLRNLVRWVDLERSADPRV